MLSAAGMALAALSALLLYLASPNCRTRRFRLRRRLLQAGGGAAALAALALCCVDLGLGAGLAAMLGAWMLALVLLPWLALRWPAEDEA
jgi:hypothetical protein